MVRKVADRPLLFPESLMQCVHDDIKFVQEVSFSEIHDYKKSVTKYMCVIAENIRQPNAHFLEILVYIVHLFHFFNIFNCVSIEYLLSLDNVRDKDSIKSGLQNTRTIAKSKNNAASKCNPIFVRDMLFKLLRYHHLQEGKLWFYFPILLSEGVDSNSSRWISFRSWRTFMHDGKMCHISLINNFLSNRELWTFAFSRVSYCWLFS